MINYLSNLNMETNKININLYFYKEKYNMEYIWLNVLKIKKMLIYLFFVIL